MVLTASSQNCCSLLADLSAVLAAGGTLVVTTGSIFAHQIHRESGMPCAFAFATLVWFSSLLPKAASRNAEAASDNVTRGACTSSPSSGSSSSVAGSSSSTLDFLEGERYRWQLRLYCSVACRMLPVGLRHCVWPRALTSTPRPLWT